jgi:hypothetical protein
MKCTTADANSITSLIKIGGGRGVLVPMLMDFIGF